MIHCNALVYHPDDLYNFFGEPWEGKVVQLGGSDPEAMAKAAKLVQDNGYKEVNVNGMLTLHVRKRNIYVPREAPI